MIDDFEIHDISIYAGYIDNDELLMSSSSGGIATALSEHMIDIGGNVVGVSYSDDFYSAEYIIVKEKKDLHKLKGSKYIDSKKNNIYSDVKKLLNNNEKVLFFGLPCVVAALKNYLSDKYENLITCELICHGAITSKVHSDFIKYLEKKFDSKVVEFSVRYKKKEWTPPYLYAKFQNGKKFIKKFYDTQYGTAFSILGKMTCYACPFKGNNRKGDIMIGDFWGATSADEFWNKKGVSSILVETEKGHLFLNEIQTIKLYKTTFNRVVEYNPMIIKSKLMNPKRKLFTSLLLERDLIYAANHVFSTKEKIFRIIKRIIPQKLKKIIKKNYNK